MPVSKKAIADYLGISRTAVSLTINNSKKSTVSQETKEKILKAAKELGYKGYNCENKVSQKICFAICDSDVFDPGYLLSIKTVEALTNKYGYKLVIMTVQINRPEDLAKLSDYMQSDEVAGVILTGIINDNLIDNVNKSGVPYVFYAVTSREDINLIMPDHEKAGYEITKYLIGLGHRKIALFTGTLNMLIHQQFCSGYRKAFEENGIRLSKSMIQGDTEEDGYEMCGRLKVLDIEYTAIVCANTAIQFGAVQRLREYGKDIPRDISIIGYGYTELIKLCRPRLTVFAYDMVKVAKFVVDRLITIINEKDNESKKVVFEDLKLYAGGTVAITREAMVN